MNTAIVAKFKIKNLIDWAFQKILKISKNLLWSLLRVFCDQWFHMRCLGQENIPQHSAYIIAANHTSHLDAVAVNLALWEKVDQLFSLAAKDYFFDRAIKAWFFSYFFNLIPFDRQGNFVEGFRKCQQVLDSNHPILMFPEGTRSTTGEIQQFNSGLGMLAFCINVSILPIYINGTYQALPKGKYIPRRHPIKVFIGKPLQLSSYKAKLGDLTKREICQLIVEDVQAAIVELKETLVLSESKNDRK